MISVLMLTYNREDMMSYAIESILAQTYKNFEFIIVDNGSTDNSAKIADTYAENDFRIRVIHRDRGTIGAGRNTALDAAKGDYITFIDDDDYVESDYLEFLLNLVVENNADMSICGRTDRIFDEKKIMTAEEASIELLCRKHYSVGFPAKFFKASLFDGIRFLETIRYDDIALMHKIIANAKRIAYCGHLKYNIRRHDNNNSAWIKDNKLLDPKTLDEYLAAYHSRTEYLSGRFPNSAAAFRYFEWSFMLSMVEKINRLEIKGCERQLEQMLSVLIEHREEFLDRPEIQDFEREWIDKYIKV